VEAEVIEAPGPMEAATARAEARLLAWMLAWTAAGTLAALKGWSARAAGSFLLGAALAVLNYLWLHQAVVALMDAGRVRLPKRAVAKFILRYPLAIAGLFLLYRTGWLSFPALLAGLFVPVGGVLAEAGVQIAKGLRSPSLS